MAPGRYLPGAPTDPDVRTLAHPVPQPTGSPSTWVPEAIQSSYGDMHKNLDVFDMFPSIESASRRFASLHRVLRSEFPSFNGTIKALRHPAAIPPHFVSFAWRYLGCTRCLRSSTDECAAEAWSWSPGVSSRDFAEEQNRALPSSWGTPIVRLHMFLPTPAGLLAPDH